jgi:hypothetical protein
VEEGMSETVFFQAILLVSGTIVVLASLWFYRGVLELRHERRIPIAVDGLKERLERIELAVDATAVEVERISEANRFMAKLLSDRVGALNLMSRPERVITPH